MINEIKKVATHFSEEIRKKANHLDEVIIAGEIKNIIPPMSEGSNNLNSSYILELDDKVGSIYVYVSPLMKSFFNFLDMNEFVSLSGYVNVIHRKVGDKTVKEFSVVAFDASNLNVGELA